MKIMLYSANSLVVQCYVIDVKYEQAGTKEAGLVDTKALTSQQLAACRVIRECLQSTRICFYVDPVLLKFYMSYMTLICLYTHKKSV